MSLMKYGSGPLAVTLPYVDTHEFRQETMYEESMTDWYCTRFSIEVSCVLHPDYLSLLVPDLVTAGALPSGTTAAQLMKIVRARLLKPRLNLSFKFNGVEQIPQPVPGPGTVDAQNGPRPIYCNIVELNSTTFFLVYRIVAHYWENRVNRVVGTPMPGQVLTDEATGNTVLYNRWTESVIIDHANYSKRVREGKFIIRSDNSEGLIADQVRQNMAVVGIPAGFLREEASYVQSPDGLGIQYRLVDKEVFKLPPAPAFRAMGSYTESTGKSGVNRSGSCTIRLEGSKITSQARLINVAVGVVATKLRTNGAGFVNDATGSLGILQAFSLTVDMYENVVECTMKTLFNQGSTGRRQIRLRGYAGIRLTGQTVTPLSEQGETGQPGYALRGTASILLQAANYYDPSRTNVVVDQSTGQLNAGLPPGTAGTTLENP